jgi:hypothetical protein
MMDNPLKTLGTLRERLKLEPAPLLKMLTWNGMALGELCPWGTISKATPQTNRATGEELSLAEQKETRSRARRYLDIFDYKGFL